MIKKLLKVCRKIITSVFVLYGLNLILNSVNIIIPINIITVAVISILGFPGLFSLLMMFFVIR